MEDELVGLTYCKEHVYKILRAKYTNGGGSKVSPDEFDEVITGLIFSHAIMEMGALLPDTKMSKALENIDVRLPKEMVEMRGRITNFLSAHGPSAPLAVALMSHRTWMTFMGLKDVRLYFRIWDRLFTKPPSDFHEYAQVIADIEKEITA